jgi:hypothetical protein
MEDRAQEEQLYQCVDGGEQSKLDHQKKPVLPTYSVLLSSRRHPIEPYPAHSRDCMTAAHFRNSTDPPYFVEQPHAPPSLASYGWGGTSSTLLQAASRLAARRSSYADDGGLENRPLFGCLVTRETSAMIPE